jgi:hypothetical protein
MKTYTLFIILTFSMLITQSLKMMAQTNSSSENNQRMTEYFYVSIDFCSIGQGIDAKARDELFEYINKIQKKFKAVLFYERIHWGKEGEETIYLDLRNLSLNERQNVLNDFYSMFRDRNKMAYFRLNLYFEPDQQQLVLGISMYGQLETRENILLNYIEKWEKRSRFKINPGDMINETAIPEDQDRRNQLNLSGLGKEQITEIVNKAQEIMQVSLPNSIEVDFKGIGSSNNNENKDNLNAYLIKFQKENKVKIDFNFSTYEMNKGGGLCTIRIDHLKDELKKKLVDEVNKMFAKDDKISLAYY